MKKKKKKLKLKKSVKITLLLIVLIIFGIKFLNNKEVKVDNIDLTIELLKKETYLNKTTNNTDTEIKSEWEELITNYLDLYYKSLIGLETKDITNLFTESNGSEAYFIENAIDLLVSHHEMQDSDMTLTKAKYDIEYKEVNIQDNIVTIEFLVDDYINFKYLGDIESREIDVEYEIVIRKENDLYKIDSLRVVQGNFVMFTNEIDLTLDDAKEQIDSLKQQYMEAIKEDYEENKELMNEAATVKYSNDIICDHEYDKDAAVEYSYKFVDNRNEDYIAYDDVGGNCQNFVSQSIHAGGIPMDTIGDYEWKHYGDGVNEKNEKKGRSTSWTGTINFYDYAKGNTGTGMCTDTDENIFYAEPGDVAHVGYKGYSHAVIVAKQIYDDSGKMIDFLINSNTASLENYPFMGYVYPNKRIIKILGYND